MSTALRQIVHHVLVVLGGVGLTLLFFLVLPLVQAISKAPESDVTLQKVDTANLPPPPPAVEEEPEPEEEPEEPPPELADEAPPLDLAQLELALDPGFSSGWMSGDFGVNLDNLTRNAGTAGADFSLADLDQRPRAVHQPSPALDAKLRRRPPGTVHVLFIVDERGRVENPIVQKSTDPMFDKAALAAVEQWRFEPGKRKGETVRFKMRVPITFPTGG